MSGESLGDGVAFEVGTMMLELTMAGMQALRKDDPERALSLFKGAFLLSCKEPTGQGQGTCLFNLGAAYVAVGKPKKGLKCFKRSKQHRETSEEGDGDLHFNIGIAYEGMGQLDKALPFYQRAARKYGSRDPSSQGDALIKLAYCYKSLDDHATAGQSFAQAAWAYQQAGQREDTAMALQEAAKHNILSGVASEMEVVQLLQECLRECWEGVNDAVLRVRLVTDVGLHYAQLGEYSQAMTCFLAALEDCNRREDKGKTKAVLLQNIGAIHNAQAQYSTSLSYHVHAAELFGALGQRRGQAESLGNLAYAFSQLRDYQAAALCYQEALQAFRAVGDLHGHWQMCEGLGASHFCLGDTQKAIEYYKQALAVSEEPKGIWAIPRERIQRKLTEVLQNAGAVEDTQL